MNVDAPSSRLRVSEQPARSVADPRQFSSPASAPEAAGRACLTRSRLRGELLGRSCVTVAETPAASLPGADLIWQRLLPFPGAAALFLAAG